ncbi:transposase [Bradyrhizobium ottawaense]
MGAIENAARHMLLANEETFVRTSSSSFIGTIIDNYVTREAPFPISTHLCHSACNIGSDAILVQLLSLSSINRAWSRSNWTDLPLSGRVVQLLVIARRFRCDAVLCGRHIFTERFADRNWLHRRDARRGWTPSSITWV